MVDAEDFDGVIVVGAGPVGLFTALKLTRAGIPVIVLEALDEIIKSPRAAGYQWPIPKAFDGAGILGDAKKVGLVKRVNQFRDLAGNVHRMQMKLLDTALEQPYDLPLGQHVLAEVILGHLLRLSNVSVRWRHRVVGVAQDAETVTATIETDGKSHKLCGRWLVAADGSRSTVRHALGLSFDGHTWPDRFVATNVYYPFDAHGFDGATFLSDPVHWAIFIKINQEGLWRVAYGEDAGITEEEVRRRVNDHYAVIMPGKEKWELATVGSYRVHERCAERFRVGRVLLAGDAAHICNPAGGFGLAGGFIDAVSVANALTDLLTGSEGEAILDRYAEERRRIFLEFTSPTASEIKRRLSEADPERRKQDFAGVRHVCEDPELTRKALLLPSRLVGELAADLLR